MKRIGIVLLLLLAASFARADEVQEYRELARRLDHEAILRKAEASRPTPPEARALYIRALARTFTGDAREAAEELRKEHPNDPWSWYAVAVSSDQTIANYDELEPATAKMMELAKEPADDMIVMRTNMLRDRGRFDEAHALLEGKTSPALLVARGSLLIAQTWSKKDDAKFDEALALFEQARKLDPTFLEGYFRAAVNLRIKRRNEEAYALIKQAAAMTSALGVHREYWAAIRANKSIAEDEKHDEIDADIASLRRERGDSMPLLIEIASEYSTQKREDEAETYRKRVLAEAPGTRYAQQVLYARYNAFRREHGAKINTDPELRKKNLQMIRELIALPAHPDPRLLAQMYMSYFSAALSEPASVSDEELLKIVRGMEPLGQDSPTTVYASGAKALATRGYALEEAETIVREGLVRAEKYIANERLAMEIDTPTTELEKFESYTRSLMRDALGWVLLKRGRVDEARTQLLAAYEYESKNEQVLYHLGQLHEMRNQLAKAEDFYRRGAIQQTPGENSSRTALKDLYAKRRGSLAGYDDYLRTLNDRDAAKRRKQILAARERSPRGTPAFSLKTLDGKTLRLADLRGKVAVINFWGVWCGWCVKEMPDYQKLAEKYENDPNVAILTINNDNDDPKVKKWMAEQKYDFAVLLDDGFVSKIDVRAFPTTWFVDPTGKIAFEKKGWTEKLVEEFSWRVEDIRVKVAPSKMPIAQ